MKVDFSEDFHEDIDRIKDHLISHGAHVEARIAEIFKALRILQFNPYIGHEVEEGFRELVIGDKRKHRGYVALYDVYPEHGDGDDDDEVNEPDGVVVVLAIRSQHESGYH